MHCRFSISNHGISCIIPFLCPPLASLMSMCLLATIIMHLPDFIIIFIIGKCFNTLHCLPFPDNDDQSHVEDFQQPLVMIWNPNVSFTQVVQERLKNCVSCGAPYGFGYWNDGTSVKRQPRRVLHDFDNIVYLISAVYICPNNHRLLVHDLVVLDCFPIKRTLPFIQLGLSIHLWRCAIP